MRKDTTNQELMLILQDIETQSQTSITYSIFNAQKIKQFREANAARITMFNDAMNKLVVRLAKKDDKEMPVLVILDGRQQLDFETPEDKELFTAEYNELLKKPIQLIL